MEYNTQKRKWSKEEKVKIVLEGMHSSNILEVCRKYQVAPGQWYEWRDAFLEKGEEGLEDHRRVGKNINHLLEVENRRLLHLVGRQTLMLEEQKKLLGRLHGRTRRKW